MSGRIRFQKCTNVYLGELAFIFFIIGSKCTSSLSVKARFVEVKTMPVVELVFIQGLKYRLLFGSEITLRGLFSMSAGLNASDRSCLFDCTDSFWFRRSFESLI